MRSSGDDAVELAAIAGLDLDPWQQHVLRVALGERADGKWSALEVGLLCPRQNGKGSVLEARELAGLFLFGERTIIHSAHEMKTAVEAFIRIRDLCKNTPELDEQVRAYYQSNEKTAIELKNGQRLRFMARSDGSGRGFTGDTIILDEAYNLPHATLRAIFSTMSAKSIDGNPQLWYTSSAGMLTSEVLASVRERGTKGDKRLAFLEWSAPDDADLNDRRAWALANPGLNIRIAEEFVEAERGALDDEGFARERLGIWHDPRRGSVIIPEVWHDHGDASSQVEDGTIVIALDVAPMNASASLSIAGRRADGRPHVEVVKHQKGSGWMVEAAIKLAQNIGTTDVVLDPSGPAGALSAPLREAGLTVRETNAREMAQACVGFHRAFTEGDAVHIEQPILTTALAGAGKRELHGLFAWSRKHATSDITPLVSVTLTLWALGQSALKPKPKQPSAVYAF